MAKIHDKFIIELAEVIKGYGNDQDVEDPFCLSTFYRFYELPNIAVSRENFKKMTPYIEERKTGKWLPDNTNMYEIRFVCSNCKESQVVPTIGYKPIWDWCPNCGADMREQP